MTDEKALQILKHWKDICNKYMRYACEECESECIYPHVINALEKQIKEKKFRKIDKVLMKDIVFNYCPSDYKMKNKSDCTFSKTGIVNENECIQCWFSEVEND